MAGVRMAGMCTAGMCMAGMCTHRVIRPTSGVVAMNANDDAQLDDDIAHVASHVAAAASTAAVRHSAPDT